jgi:hypothetical protein
MWRFLLAGLGTIGGVVLLFFASFGDPAPSLRDLPSSRVVIAAPTTQAETVESTATATASVELPAASPPPPAPIVTPPVYHGPISYALPWRTSPEPVRRIHSSRPTPSPARFFAAFRHDLRALFRVSSR